MVNTLRCTNSIRFRLNLSLVCCFSLLWSIGSWRHLGSFSFFFLKYLVFHLAALSSHMSVITITWRIIIRFLGVYLIWLGRIIWLYCGDLFLIKTILKLILLRSECKKILILGGFRWMILVVVSFLSWWSFVIWIIPIFFILISILYQKYLLSYTLISMTSNRSYSKRFLSGITYFIMLLIISNISTCIHSGTLLVGMIVASSICFLIRWFSILSISFAIPTFRSIIVIDGRIIIGFLVWIEIRW